MGDSPDVTSFFLELRNILDKLLRFRSATKPYPSTQHCSDRCRL